MADVSSVRLGYWKIRGLAQPIRTLLHFLKVDFKDELYEQGDGPEFSRECWTSVKPKMGLDFPNLPYFIVTEASGETKLTQSNTIMRYIVRKFGAGSGLYEGTPEELAAIDMAIDQTVDLRQQMTRTAYGAMPFDSFKAVWNEQKTAFEAFFAKDDRKFMTGNKITLADFVLHEVLAQVRAMFAELGSADAFADTPRLSAFTAAFEAETAIAEYINSEEYIARPFNNKVAVWK